VESYGRLILKLAMINDRVVTDGLDFIKEGDIYRRTLGSDLDL